MVGTRLSRVNRSCASRPNASRPGLSTRSTSLPKSNNGEVSSMLNTPFWFWGLNRSSLNSCKMSRPNCLPENFCSVPFSKRMVISGFSPYEQQTNWPDEGAMALERMSVPSTAFMRVDFPLLVTPITPTRILSELQSCMRFSIQSSSLSQKLILVGSCRIICWNFSKAIILVI